MPCMCQNNSTVYWSCPRGAQKKVRAPLRGSLELICRKMEKHGGQWDNWAGKER